jgi:hypothetical protein
MVSAIKLPTDGLFEIITFSVSEPYLALFFQSPPLAFGFQHLEKRTGAPFLPDVSAITSSPSPDGAFMVSSYCALTKKEDLQCLSHDLPHRFHVLPSLPRRSRSLVCESIPAPLMGYIPSVLDGLTPIFQPFGNMLSAHLMILFFWHFSA